MLHEGLPACDGPQAQHAGESQSKACASGMLISDPSGLNEQLLRGTMSASVMSQAADMPSMSPHPAGIMDGGRVGEA